MDKNCPITGKKCIGSECMRYSEYYVSCEIERKLSALLYRPITGSDMLSILKLFEEITEGCVIK